MPLDHLIALPAKRRQLEEACDRTHRWLDRSVDAHNACEHGDKGVLFGICQGGDDLELRRTSAKYIATSDVSGSAIGGLSVGESKEAMAQVLDVVVPVLPDDRPRYLMGVGSPEDMWDCVARGVDMFDCVLPTRLARNGALLTPDGRIDIKSKQYKYRFEPVDPVCDCTTCTEFTIAYVHHLFRAKELLGLRLASQHNLRFMARCMESIRQAIEQDAFNEAHVAFDQRYRPVMQEA